MTTPKKTISFVQANFQQGPKSLNAYFLPYSIGVLWSYCSQFESVTDNYQLDQIIWRRDSITSTVKKLSHSDVVGFSCYIWNKKYNLKLAQRLKEINPLIKIIFGGPEITITKTDVFKTYPFIDIIVKKEGEYTFKDLLENIDAPENVAGLLVNKFGNRVDTGESVRIENLDTIPSPYLSGIFDKLIKENPDVRWSVTLESNRGCPYQCTFCDWGSLTYNKIKKFDLERVLNEIEWIGKNKCGYLYLADANFGVFPERDLTIAQKIVEVQKKYGYPDGWNNNYAKNQKKSVLEIAKFLKDSGSDGMFQLSLQSLDTHTLKTIKRTNMEINKAREIFEECDRYNIPVSTELILGLPGETLDSWKNNFYKLFEAGLHHGLNVYQAQILENSELNLLQRKLHNIETFESKDFFSAAMYNTDDYEIIESVETVKSTKEMPWNDMVDAFVFSWFINTFHALGLTTYISRVLNKQEDISYKEFYEKLYTYLCNHTEHWLHSEMQRSKQDFINLVESGSGSSIENTSLTSSTFTIFNRTIIAMHSCEKTNEVFEFIDNFVKSNFNLDLHFLDQLVEFQRSCIIEYSKVKNYPLVNTFDYDFLGFLRYNQPLISKKTYRYINPHKKYDFLHEYAEQIHFGRKKHFGRADIYIE